MKLAIRILLALFFLISGYFKVVDVDQFELFVYSFGWLPFWTITILSRFYIGFELVTGVILLLGIWLRSWMPVVIFTLLGSMVLLLVGYSMGANEYCQCYGPITPLTPPLIALKLGSFLILALLASRKDWLPFRGKNIVTIILMLAGLSLPFILSPPDFLAFTPTPPGAVSLEDIEVSEEGQSVIDSMRAVIEKEKVVFCFYSTRCKFCQRSARKLTTMAKRLNFEEHIAFLMAGKDPEISLFYERSQCADFPFGKMKGKDLLTIARGSIPKIYLFENEQLVQSLDYRTLNEADIKAFLNK